MITGPPLLQWKELRDFPGEFKARVGDLVFCACATEYSIDVPGKTEIRTVAHGDVKCLYAAKRACQAFLNRIHRDLQRMLENTSPASPSSSVGADGAQLEAGEVVRKVEPPRAAVVAGQNSPERGLTPAAGEMVEVGQ